MPQDSNKEGATHAFFLGGRDLEMSRIATVLTSNSIPFFDKGLEWGAKASTYQTEIEAALEGDKKPVLIELENDLVDAIADRCTWIDHHGNRSSEPASILQVLGLIGVAPTRRDQLIAANDSGYIPAMLAMGATQDEIDEIRREDRAAQGVTPEMEVEAVTAIESSLAFGPVKCVYLQHSKWCCVSDRLFQTWPDGKENLIVICGTDLPDSLLTVNYFGRGDICQTVKELFANAWGGGKGYGDSAGQGYAGCTTKHHAHVVRFILNQNVC